MKNWKNLEANSNLIQTDTGTAVLIKIPKQDFVFWHPAKLVRTSGKNGYKMSIGYTDDFTFKIFKQGKGKYNKFAKIDEREITAEKMRAYFGEEN